MKIVLKIKLIYEGEYKNGKRNGKGKEYQILNNQNTLIFEGEYGKKWNGKGAFQIGEELFEGEYLNGERNGKGKEYYDNGKLLFDGEYLNGKKWNGKGYNYEDNLEYEIKNGKGKVN